MHISDLSGYNLIGLASSLSILLSQGLTPNEIGLLSAFFSTLGDNLAIISSTPITSSLENSIQENNSQKTKTVSYDNSSCL